MKMFEYSIDLMSDDYEHYTRKGVMFAKKISEADSKVRFKYGMWNIIKVIINEVDVIEFK